jgi:hypothetical protein
MEKENETTKISTEDLSFLAKELSKTDKPLHLEDLTRKIAFKKSAHHLSHEVKKYDPHCKYEVGDLVYKEYNEPLIVSSKGTEQFQGSVVLKVINKIPYDSFNCEMLEVDYSGGGTFRKHIDYMKKTKTQVLIPSNLDGKANTPEILKREDDPRLSELPMTDKDLKRLSKNLNSALEKSDEFFRWRQLWQLSAKLVAVGDKNIKALEKYFKDTKRSATTTDLVSQLLGKDPADDQFDLHCLSLNHILEKEHKKNIFLVSPEGWGKWLPKETLDSFFKNTPLSTRRAKVPALEEAPSTRSSPSPNFPLKIYLTWREILSGGIKVPKKVNKELSKAREYIFTDSESEKSYTVYYYPSAGVFLGLKEFFEDNNVPQGASLTLEKKEETKISFWLKKSKKKLSLFQVTYNAKDDKFELSEEEFQTHCLPHKIIHLENETLQKLFTLYAQRDKHDLSQLLMLVFKTFGLEGEALSLHSLRAFHLVDMLKHTSQEDVDRVLLGSQEFSQSEKNVGIFFYHETSVEEKPSAEVGIDVVKEKAPPSEVKELPGEDLPEIGTVGEIEAEVTLQTVEEVKAPEKIKEEPPPPPPAPAPEPPKKAVEKETKEPPAKPKKAKAPKKKRPKIQAEPERAPRRRRGEKKFIEERIELEESELEALFAVKEDTTVKPEAPIEKKDEPAKEKKEEFELTPSEEPMSGIFADMLKSALEKKKPKDKKDAKAKKKKK